MAHSTVKGSRGRAVSPGVMFSSPWIIGFFAFFAVPVVASLYYSFTDFNLFQSPTWVGLENYRSLVSDELFRKAMFNTAYLTVVGVPLGQAIAMLIALALNFPVRGQPLYRAIVYLPSIVPIVAATYVWRWMLSNQHAAFNDILGVVGLSPPNWLLDPVWTKPAVILIGLWTVGGTSIIYLAALQQVPQQLYEAAVVDGANTWQRFRHVTWPALSPVTLFQVLMGIIASVQIFAQTYLLAQDDNLNAGSGGPADSLLTFAMLIVNKAFVYLDMGGAAAMAWILFMIIGALTAVVLISSKRWVHYGYE